MKRISCRVNGLHLEVAVEARSASKDRVCFIHGLGCSRDSFQEAWQQEELHDLSLLSLDLPGFGDSPGPEAYSYAMEDQAAVCAAVLENFAGCRTHLVAHSMGGAVALLLAERLGKALASFVNIEGNLVAEDCGLVSRKVARLEADDFRKNYYPVLKKQAARDYAGLLHLEKASARAFHQSSVSLVHWSRSGRLLEIFRSLTCPRIYCYGEKSANPATLEALADMERQAFPGCGHFLMNEDPAAFYTHCAGLWLA